MDRRQTVVNVTCEVSPKHNNQFRCRLVTYICVTGTNIPYNTTTNKFTYQHISHRTKTTRVQKQQQAPPLHNLITNDLHISIRELRYYISLFTIRQPPWQHLRLPTILQEANKTSNSLDYSSQTLRIKFLTDPVKQRSTRAIHIYRSMIAIKMLSNLLPSERMTNRINHLHVL
jgi:hypothetical protein